MKIYKEYPLMSICPGYPNSTYYAVVKRNKEGGALFYFTNDKGCNTAPWGLKSILYGDKWSGPVGNVLSIDYGQGWEIRGLDSVLPKIREDFPQELL